MVERPGNHRKTIESNGLEAESWRWKTFDCDGWITPKHSNNHLRLKSKNHQIRWLASQKTFNVDGQGQAKPLKNNGVIGSHEEKKTLLSHHPKKWLTITSKVDNATDILKNHLQLQALQLFFSEKNT